MYYAQCMYCVRGEHTTVCVMQTARLPSPERQACGNSQRAPLLRTSSPQPQQRLSLTNTQRSNLHQAFCTVNELALGKRPDDTLLRFIMSKPEPMYLDSTKMVVASWSQQLEQRALQQHQQHLLIQQRLQQYQQQQEQGSIGTQPVHTSNAAQQPTHTSNAAQEQPAMSKEYCGPSLQHSSGAVRQLQHAS